MCLQIITDNRTWQPTGVWQKPGGLLALLLLDGACQVQTLACSRPLPPCHMLVLPATDVTAVSLEDARALLFEIPELETLNLPQATALVVDELASQVLLSVFFEHERPEAHQRSALALVCHQIADRQISPPRPAGDLVQRALAYMEAHLDEPITQTQLLEHLHCSRSRLHDQFRRANLPAPMQALAKLRIGKASEWLEKTDWTISQIAAEVGYADLAAFSHFFKKHTDQSPSEFRANFRWLL